MVTPGEFEAVASYGIGQASKAGFRVFALSDPNRVVIDLAAPPDGNLPRTGSSVPPITALGLGLVILGLGSYLLARRRPAIVNGSYRSQVRRHRR